MSGETVRLERRLTPSQSARRERMREAARALACEGGYAAVTIRSVAERAGVGPATVYRYFSSKDHLLAEVHAHESRKLVEALRASAPGGGGRAERIEAVFSRLLEAVTADPDLSAAAVIALTSGDPAAWEASYWRERVMVPYLDVALGDEQDAPDREALAEILGHLFFSLMVSLATGRMDLAHAREVAGRAIRLMVHPA